jgi:hypothetical protein
MKILPIKDLIFKDIERIFLVSKTEKNELLRDSFLLTFMVVYSEWAAWRLLGLASVFLKIDDLDALTHAGRSSL